MSGIQDYERAAFVAGFLLAADRAQPPWDDSPMLTEEDALKAWSYELSGHSGDYGDGILAAFRPRRMTLEDLAQQTGGVAALTWPG